MQLQQIIKLLQSKTLTAKQKGNLFERAVRFYLENDSIQKSEFKKVAFYGDFVANWQLDQPLGVSQQDLGIDLIATRHNDTLCAVQCKYRLPTVRISKTMVDSFYAEVRRLQQKGLPIAETIVFDSTAINWSDHARKYLDDRNRRFSWEQMLASDIREWSPARTPLSPSYRRKAEHKPVKQLRPYQRTAVQKVLQGLVAHDRGQLIMACGTGKTFTALRIMERMVRGRSQPGLFLFLVPSLALINQTLQEWFYNKIIPLHAIVVCSDKTVGQQYDALQDAPDYLLIRPTTQTVDIVTALVRFQQSATTSLVVFCTYQSLPRIVEAQQQKPQIKFNLVIADEAHNTAGVKKEASSWTVVHDQQQVKAEKRLYMTATPKVYDYQPKKKESHLFFNMEDNPGGQFGAVFYRFNFYDAVKQGCLSNYKLIVSYIKAWDYPELKDLKLTTLNEAEQIKYEEGVQKNEYLPLNLVQLYRAICKDVEPQFGRWEKLIDRDLTPMQRLIIFNPRIWQSELIAKVFTAVVEKIAPEQADDLHLGINHVDGKTAAKERSRLIRWLQQARTAQCRILTNARCLSEGIDVPALDAVAFLNQKTGVRGRSRIGLIQAVGRVMRTAPHKTEGYIILPVVVVKKDPNQPISESNQQLLNSSYSNLVQIVNDLTSHDEVFRRQLDQYKLSKRQERLLDKIIIVGDKKSKTLKHDQDSHTKQSTPRSERDSKIPRHTQLQLEIVRAIKDGIFTCVARAGNRVKSLTDFEAPLRSFRTKVNQHLKRALQFNLKFKTAIHQFTQDLKTTINDSVTEQAAIDMVLQHYLTLPVFESIFRNHDFVRQNLISQALERVISSLGSELKQLRSNDADYQAFLQWVKDKTEGLSSWQDRDAFVKKFYSSFFRIFDPRVAQKLGIVYTPNEVVDFMLKGVQYLLKKHFNTSFNDENVNVLDPFAGTGTFLTHLLGSPHFITAEKLLNKYKSGVFAKEILLLPYYLSSLNLQTTLVNRYQTEKIKSGGRLLEGTIPSYNGIGLTDTFAEYEQAKISQQIRFEIKDAFLQTNQGIIDRQAKTKINVIITNPPYFHAQTKPGDLNQRTSYEHFYKEWKKIINDQPGNYSLVNLYNSAYMALFWAHWRLLQNNNQGIIAFIIPNGFLKSRSGGGLRAFLSAKFAFIYVLDLHGDIRAGMFIPQQKVWQGQNIFDPQSQTGIQILILVYVQTHVGKGIIHYCSINNVLKGSLPTKANKLNFLAQANFHSVFTSKFAQEITLDCQASWFYHSDHLLITKNRYFLNLFKKDWTSINRQSVFTNRTNGNVTHRDSWCINFSVTQLSDNMRQTIDFYNQQLNNLKHNYPTLQQLSRVLRIVDKNSQKIKWSRAVYRKIIQHRASHFRPDAIRFISHRPFCQTNLYYSKFWNEEVCQTKRLFSLDMNSNRRRVVGVCIAQQGGRLDVLAVRNHVVGLRFIESSKFYPLYTFTSTNNSLDEEWTAESNITPFVRRWVRTVHPNLSDKELFAYLYGLFHSPDYRQQFYNHLMYEPPRFCLIKKQQHFTEFRRIGQELLDLHLNYETRPITAWYGCEEQLKKLKPVDFQLNARGMRFAKGNDQTKDYTTIIFNDQILWF